MNSPLHIALCCNGTMLPGLHATLASLVKHLGRRQQVTLTLFFQDISETELESIRGTISDAGGVGELRLRNADVTDFKSLKALHDDWMTYLRLYLPRLIPEAETILYLDSDLVVNTDACACFNESLGNFPLGAVHGATVAWDLDGKFLKTVGLTDNDLVFNAGVLLLNAEIWRKTGLIDQALAFGQSHASFLRSADQTILNALFSRNFHQLPPKYNISIGPADKTRTITEGIYHFVGSPKPWDLFGWLFHRNWRIWKDAIIETEFSWNDFLYQHLIAYSDRAWTLRRSYLRTIRDRIKSG